MRGRALLARVAPAPAKRLHQRWSEMRFRRWGVALAHEWIARHGTTVVHGPFAGMHYLPECAGVPMLAGVYENELHGVIQEWVAAQPSVVVDVGCSEGYYAVGLARALPDATVYAFDIDPAARELCGSMAALNGVADRVIVEAECTPERLRGFPEESVCLFVDCEGCETALLDPVRVPLLNGWRMLVELHDFLDPTTSQTIIDRFTDTHRVRVIEERPRSGDEVPELSAFAPRERVRALDERRPAVMRWVALDPG